MLKNKKGIAFTIDAVFALVLAVLLITATLVFISDNTFSNKKSLDSVSKSVLTVLEKDFMLKNAIEFDSLSELSVYINTLPSQYCFILSIKNQSKSEVIDNVTKSNCVQSEEIIYTRRVFVYNQEIYYAELISWYKDV